MNTNLVKPRFDCPNCGNPVAKMVPLNAPHFPYYAHGAPDGFREHAQFSMKPITRRSLRDAMRREADRCREASSEAYDAIPYNTFGDYEA